MYMSLADFLVLPFLALLLGGGTLKWVWFIICSLGAAVATVSRRRKLLCDTVLTAPFQGALPRGG